MSYRLVRLFAVVLATAALAVGLLIGGGMWKPVAAGLPDAGQAAAWIKQLTYLVTTLLGIRVIGLITRLAFFLPSVDGQLSEIGRIEIRKINKFSGFWSIANIFAALLTLQFVLGISFRELFSPNLIGTYLFSLAPARNFMLAAIFALGIATSCFLINSLNSVLRLFGFAIAAISIPLLNSHSASLGDHSLAITSSLVHGLAMSLWVGGLWAVVPDVKANNARVISRFSVLAKTAFLLLVISGFAAAYARLDSFSDLWNSGYGRLVILKLALLTGIAIIAAKIRANYARGINVSKFVGVELLVMATAIGLGIALHGSPISRTALELPTAAEEILGFSFPAPPSYKELLLGWHPDWMLLGICLTAIWLYLAAIIRLRKQKISWPIARTFSFLLGILLIGWATSSGISRYAMISFTYHMVQHMMLSMLAPIFLVLGAPITLALRALPAAVEKNERNARLWITSLLHSGYAKFITQPLFVLAIFTFSLYGMYFTPIFAILMSSHTGHLFMELHFLLSGTLFTFIVVGVDPAPRRVPHIARLLLVLVAISLHAFFAIAIMQSTSPLGEAWYGQVRPPWITVGLEDTKSGGGIAWAFGEIPSLILMVLVAVQWAKSDAKVAARLDRQADRDGDAELNSYNEYLSKLNKEVN